MGRERLFVGRDVAGACARHGYRQVTLSKVVDGQQVYKVRFVHRLVLEAFRGPCPAGMMACHGNGVPHDNRLENLRWGTPKENDDDKLRHGTYYRRWMCYKRRRSQKLTDDQIREIRTSDTPHTAAAKKYGVSEPTVYRIRKRRAWASIP